MPLQLLSENPLYFLAWVIAIVVALTTHEFAHALVATKLGDSTPGKMGRLTLNPVAHIDPLGFLALVLVGFGWAKPVPFNPYNLVKAPRWGPTLVAFAGPLTNLLNVIIFGAVLKFASAASNLEPFNLGIQFLNLLVVINVVLFVFNFIPIPPLDGSKLLYSILSSPKYDQFKIKLETRGPIILLLFLILDDLLGFHIFSTILRSVINFVYSFF
jgi:Zn-dependent protease